MKTLLIIDENGQYKDKQGKRCNLLCCTWVKGERASKFKDFDTLKHALEYYNLVDPNEPVEEEHPEEEGEEENYEEGLQTDNSL